MITQLIEFDVKKNSHVKITAKEGDINSRNLEFRLLDNSLPFSLVGRTVRCYMVKPDKRVVFNDLNIIDAEDGRCVLTLSLQSLIVSGMAKLELIIYEASKKLSVIPIKMNIIKSLNSDNLLESTNEFGALNNALWKIDTFTETMNSKASKEDLKKLSSQLEHMDNKKTDKTTTDNIQSQVNNLVLGAVGDGNNAEVIQAKVDYVGNTFNTLKSKNDNVEKLLFEKISLYNNFTFEQGGIGTNGDYEANNRLRSVGFLTINGIFNIEIDSLWKYNLLEYNTEGILIKNYGFTSDKTTIDGTKGGQFRIVLGKSDNTTIAPDLVEDILLIQYTPNFGIFSDLKQVGILKASFTDKELKSLKTESGYYQKDNFAASSTNVTYYYDVKGLKSINLTTTQTQYKNIYTLLDDSYNVVDYLIVNDTSLTLNNQEIKLDGVSYIAISELKSSPVDNKKITYLTPITKSDSTGDTFGKWHGKKFVWFGTSIPAGAKEGKNNPLSYPIILGDRLGATVINEAVGESSLHCKAVHRISESNPYGFEENWNKCARCLTNTLEEVEWLLANWNNTTVFTTGTLTTLTEEDKAFYRRCSYENKLLPHLESGDVDLFVLDHGHNDRYNSNKKNGAYVDDSVIMQEYGEFNLYTFEGASNFIINKILSSNPMNKICFIGEYENQKLPLVSQFQLKVADKWCYPLYKQWERLGWTQNKITTTGYWNNATGLWVESGGESQEITMLKRWIRDNIHPSSDNSGKATEWLLDNMEVWFLNNL